MSESVQKIDAGLAIYYKLKGRNDYFDDNKGKFEIACDENGFGDDDIAEEMAASADECMLLEFDDNFPGVKKGDLEAILKVVKECYRYGKDVVFGQEDEMKDTKVTINYTKDAYEISEQEMKELGNRYKSQCPKSFLGIIEKDAATFKLMMIGEKQNSPYIQNLADDYLRCRVEAYIQDLPKKPKPLVISEWIKNHPHFKLIKKISKEYADLVAGGVKGFVTRICPALLFQPVSKIQGSVEETANLIFAAIRWVHELVKETEKHEYSAQGNCPFQVDFCIGYDPMKSIVNKGDDDDKYDDDFDDDDDDDDDNNNKTDAQSGGGGIDMIGDIIKKLESNKDNGVSHAKHKVQGTDIDRRVIRDCYKKYQEESKKESLQGQRIIGFVDKRDTPFKFNEKDEKDEQKEAKNKAKDGKDKAKDGTDEKQRENRMIIYSAPNDCNTIPSDAVNEWCLSSTSMCLIPDEKYKLQKMMCDGDSKQSVKNIGSKDNAPMITLSFYAKSAESIACYFYAMGQYTRFMPSDIINILPLLFDENIYDNEGWGKNEYDLSSDVKEMEALLVDKQFDQFRKSQCGWKPLAVDKKGKDDSK